MESNDIYPERGARRRKIAGYLRAANEMRQAYQQQYGIGGRGDGAEDDNTSMPGGFPDVSVVRNGDEEMLLFPSYARRHQPRKGHQHEMPGANDDLRSAQTPGDAEYWRREWDKYEDENAIIDVDIRGWVYAPHRGQMTRKNRLLVGIARHLSGIPAPSNSRPGSRNPSPHSLREKVEAHDAKHEEQLVKREAESITRRGQGEADVAWHGGYSEVPSDRVDRLSIHSSPGQSRSTSLERSEGPRGSLPRPLSVTSLKDDQSLKSEPSKRTSWNQPSQMTAEEISMANANLMLRLTPFLTTPLVQTPLTVFFYNEQTSKSQTITTNEAGHFQLRAPLEFIPTHVRVLASDKLSATEEVRVTEPNGISLISDIDDTIKHSGIGAGAKEIFRNAFVRDLSDLTVDGVNEWYFTMADLGVKLHYVSNAPWQLYPVLVDFFAKAGLPKGSFHLKQYSGMLQGIFEPVAERKKATLERIMSDFPERKFLLVGDSGEADLELYTDLLLSYPRRIIGVFIRDVTTTKPRAFFDSISRPPRSVRPGSPFRGRSRDGQGQSPKQLSSTSSISDIPPPPLPPRTSARGFSSASSGPQEQDGPKMGRLIDFDEESSKPSQPPRSLTSDSLETNHRASISSTRKLPPSLPSKPPNLRSTSGSHDSDDAPASNTTRKAAPPPPLKPRQYVSPSEINAPPEPSPLSQIQTTSPPNSRSSSIDRQSYRAAVRNRVASAYNSLPSFYASNLPISQGPTSNPSRTGPTSSPLSTAKDKQPPPIPPRRNLSSYPAAAATRLSSSWSNATSNANGTTNANGSNSTSSGSNSGTTPSPEDSSSPSGYSLTHSASDPASIPSKKEEMWIRRWTRAKEIFEEKGVVLRSWRIGEDVADEAVRLVERALKDDGDDETKRKGGRRNVDMRS